MAYIFYSLEFPKSHPNFKQNCHSSFTRAVHQLVTEDESQTPKNEGFHDAIITKNRIVDLAVHGQPQICHLIAAERVV